MAVKDKNSPAISSCVNAVLLDCNVTIASFEPRHKFVMVARDVNHMRAFACLPQNFLDDIIMRLRPVDSTPELPDIDQVANDVERSNVIIPQKRQQGQGIAGPCAKVNVRNPCGPETSRHADLISQLFN